MKFNLFFFLSLAFLQLPVSAANLLQVYQQALFFDPTFQQAVAQRLATKEGVPINVAAILPNIAFAFNPSYSRTGLSGTNFINAFEYPRNNNQRAYTMNLSLAQTVFNFAQFSVIGEQLEISKSADATLNAALQDLMIRVAKAYFTVLQDSDNVYYNKESENVYAKQVDEVKRQKAYRVATVTDVYTAKASYDTAVADRIDAQITLTNDIENLRRITGVRYSSLAKLKKHAPYAQPEPANEEAWVKTALAQNWSIKAAQYNVLSNKYIIREQEAGNLPIISLQGTLSRQYNDNINGYDAVNFPPGAGMISERQVALNINMPIFSGGGVVSKTRQAIYNYQVAQQELEVTVMNAVTLTRQSYNNVMLGINEIKSDEQAIQANESSVNGMEVSHRLGATSLVDLLNQEQKLFQAQIQYTALRYALIINYLTLKQATGVLSFQDLFVINQLLAYEDSTNYLSQSSQNHS